MAINRQDHEDQGALLSAHELHVTRLLGQGAYASVYLASRKNGSTVAVKGGSMARLLTKQMQDPWKHVYSHAQGGAPAAQPGHSSLPA
ncbi:hypothetical protein HaLaN_03666 [Haematococcus lacustris]|uniref:Protein kinase domain-containing protein n=1 Tax=Haematococcus lacustris TaxID=44745 RepID=A0A699YL09_HAELA|nr:hypothetical protein HaLaN_03666 [Haematococcus lacustris]